MFCCQTRYTDDVALYQLSCMDAEVHRHEQGDNSILYANLVFSPPPPSIDVHHGRSAQHDTLWSLGAPDWNHFVPIKCPGLASVHVEQQVSFIRKPREDGRLEQHLNE